METTTEELEDLSVLLLRSNKLPLSELASDNLFSAVTEGLLVIEPSGEQEKHVEQSITAGRRMLELVGVAV